MGFPNDAHASFNFKIQFNMTQQEKHNVIYNLLKETDFVGKAIGRLAENDGEHDAEVLRLAKARCRPMPYARQIADALYMKIANARYECRKKK